MRLLPHVSVGAAICESISTAASRTQRSSSDRVALMAVIILLAFGVLMLMLFLLLLAPMTRGTARTAASRTQQLLSERLETTAATADERHLSSVSIAITKASTASLRSFQWECCSCVAIPGGKPLHKSSSTIPQPEPPACPC